MLDYRGYGKSGGSITSQAQLFEDNEAAYKNMTSLYREESMVILGYSIGTGLTSKLAATNHPRMLILQAPYYSLTDMIKQNFPIMPSFLLRYKLETNEYLKMTNVPIVIFHGNADEVIYYGSSLKLQNEFKNQITLITLEHQGHNGMTGNETYKSELAKVLK